MDDYDKLDELYQQYNSETSKRKKKEILEKILELDPEDIDSMHRLIDYLPKEKHFDALLDLKEKAKKIVYSHYDENEDLYTRYEARPYVFILEDILSHYEENQDFENAYLLIKEILRINEGDNLGIRFHYVAYCIGQNKITELEEFMKKCPDSFSVACLFANLFLKEIKKDKCDGFEILLKKLPYLYALLSKEICFSNKELEHVVNSIAYYKPRGFYESLIFYKLIRVYETKESKKVISLIIPKYGRYGSLSIESRLPSLSRAVLYSLIDINKNDPASLVKHLSRYGKTENLWNDQIEALKEFQVIQFDKKDDKEIVYFDEASLPLLKMYINKERYHLDELESRIDWMIYQL